MNSSIGPAWPTVAYILSWKRSVPSCVCYLWWWMHLAKSFRKNKFYQYDTHFKVDFLNFQMTCKEAMDLWGYEIAHNVSHMNSKAFNPLKPYIIEVWPSWCGLVGCLLINELLYIFVGKLISFWTISKNIMLCPRTWSQTRQFPILWVPE